MTTYADKPWTKNYDPHVPPSLAPYPDHSLHNYLRVTATEHPNNPALITTAKLPLFGRRSSSITYAQLDAFSDSLAVALGELGLKKGDRVALIMPNATVFAISYYGVLKAGGVVAATNPTYPPAKMQHQIDDSDAEVVITPSWCPRASNPAG